MTRRGIESGLTPLPLGTYPTPVERADGLSNREAELWIKRDDLTNATYGGNKVRKLEWLLADARRRGAERLVTVGTAGSHHVLATTYFGQKQGFDVEAVLVPQPRTERALEVLRATVALGVRAVPVRSWAAAVPVALGRIVGRSRTRFIPVGGSSVTGSIGYLLAARELAAQIRQGKMPEPDVCVVALGSGGTAAGLAVGFEAEGMKTRVVGVCVAGPAFALRAASVALACGLVRRARTRYIGDGQKRPTCRALGARLAVDDRFLGGGYARPTPYADEGAIHAAGTAGSPPLDLDPTYTAKAFASALWYVRARRARVVLYWHTLSSAPLDAIMCAGAAMGEKERALTPKLLELLQ